MRSPVAHSAHINSERRRSRGGIIFIGCFGFNLFFEISVIDCSHTSASMLTVYIILNAQTHTHTCHSHPMPTELLPIWRRASQIVHFTNAQRRVPDSLRSAGATLRSPATHRHARLCVRVCVPDAPGLTALIPTNNDAVLWFPLAGWLARVSGGELVARSGESDATKFECAPLVDELLTHPPAERTQSRRAMDTPAERAVRCGTRQFSSNTRFNSPTVRFMTTETGCAWALARDAISVRRRPATAAPAAAVARCRDCNMRRRVRAYARAIIAFLCA